MQILRNNDNNTQLNIYHFNKKSVVLIFIVKIKDIVESTFRKKNV